jgi:hypothetical protein
LLDVNSNAILQSYQSSQTATEELLSAALSADGMHVYCYSSTKNLYVFDVKTGKLSTMIVVPFSTGEINGIEVADGETMIIYADNEMFKLDSGDK